MLTEIEWWGGLLYLCGALAYWITYKEIGMKWALDYIGFHLAFLTSAVLLALYFYELNSPLLQKLYVGLTVMALVSMLSGSRSPVAASRASCRQASTISSRAP